MTDYTRTLLISALITLVLIGCNNNQVATATTIPTQSPTTPVFKATSLSTLSSAPLASIQFFEAAVELDSVQWMEYQAIEHGIRLEIGGVHALNKDVAFLFGGLNVPAGTIRSILIRSDDGGGHWREVLPPVEGSQVLRITFLDNGEGWALVGWTVEGLGPVTMYHTSDYGQSWDKLSEIPGDWGSATYGMKFSDHQNGQIKMVYYPAHPGSDRLSILATADGGLTWEEVNTISIYKESKGPEYAPTLAIDIFDETELEKQFAALAGWKEESDGYGWRCFRQSCQVAGQDGSEWQVSYYREEKLPTHWIVRRRLSSREPWVVYTLPVHLDYSNGQVSVP